MDLLTAFDDVVDAKGLLLTHCSCQLSDVLQYATVNALHFMAAACLQDTVKRHLWSWMPTGQVMCR